MKTLSALELRRPGGPTVRLLTGLILAVCVNAIGQSLEAQERGADWSVFEHLVSEKSGTGEMLTRAAKYVELATGLNYWDEKAGQWRPTEESIEIQGTHAVAAKGPHKVIFAPTLDDPAGSVDLQSIDGRRFRSSVLALGYFDPVSGRRETIALLRDAPGELVPPNEVIYRDAFESVLPDFPIECDVLYTYRKGGMEQDLIVRGDLPAPETFGIPSEVARIELMTEFFEAPEPSRKPRLVATITDEEVRQRVAHPDWNDDLLDFGSLFIGEGRAFLLGDRRPMAPAGVPGTVLVAKQWVVEDGRSVLIESVEVAELAPLLDELARNHALNVPTVASPSGLLARVRNIDRREWQRRVAEQTKASRNEANSSSRDANKGLPVRLARSQQSKKPAFLQAQAAQPKRPGLVLDYVVMNVSATNFTFRGDTTYFVTDTVNLAGTTTIEGGTVIKYAPYFWGPPVPQISVLGPLRCNTSTYRPAMFTSRDDQTVGETITPSNPHPSASIYYAVHGIWFLTDTNEVILENFRFKYAAHAVLSTGRKLTVRHAQFHECQHPIYAHTAPGVLVQNVLAARTRDHIGAPLKPYGGTPLIAEHLTIVHSANLIDKDAGSSVTLRNCIIAGVTNVQAYIGQGNSSYGNVEYASPNGIFKEVGRGGFYLSDGSTNRNAAVNGVGGALSFELKELTTEGPQVLSETITLPTQLHPTAKRDTDTPDRGYHYPPLDYCISGLVISNATVTLTNGAVVGFYGLDGFKLGPAAGLLSEGSPGRPNRLVRYEIAQDGTNSWGTNPGTFHMIKSTVSGSSGLTLPWIDLRYTEAGQFAVEPTNNASGGRFLCHADSATAFQKVALSHCAVSVVRLAISPPSGQAQSMFLTNNLFLYSRFSATDTAGGTANTLALYNNFFTGTDFYMSNGDGGSWIVRDNLFDTPTFWIDGTVTASNNGFRSGMTTFGTSNKTGLSMNFVRGPMGPYYVANTGSLTNLSNAGSRTGGAAGLFHFTQRADQAKETNSLVDIGYHYASTGPGSQGLVAAFNYDEGSGTTAFDSSTNSNHGTLYNGAKWAPGRRGSGVAFNGVAAYVGSSNTPSLTLTNALTIGLWALKNSEPPNWTPYVIKRTGANDVNYGIYDYPGSTGTVWASYIDTAGVQRGLGSASQPSTNSWYHITWVWNGAQQYMYINGALETGYSTSSVPPTNSIAPLAVGGFQWSSQSLNGVIDEVTIYNRALNLAEIGSLVNLAVADRDGDGLPDYLEDRNGNGTTEGGESDWTIAASGLAPSGQIIFHTPLK